MLKNPAHLCVIRGVIRRTDIRSNHVGRHGRVHLKRKTQNKNEWISMFVTIYRRCKFFRWIEQREWKKEKEKERDRDREKEIKGGWKRKSWSVDARSARSSCINYIGMYCVLPVVDQLEGWSHARTKRKRRVGCGRTTRTGWEKEGRGSKKTQEKNGETKGGSADRIVSAFIRHVDTFIL